MEPLSLTELANSVTLSSVQSHKRVMIYCTCFKNAIVLHYDETKRKEEKSYISKELIYISVQAEPTLMFYIICKDFRCHGNRE